MIVAIHQPQYLPWLPYFDKADQCDVFIYLDNVQFQKNGVQNRNQIQTAQGPRWLTVPLRASLELTIRDTPVAGQQWRKKHQRSIEQEYRRAASFAWYGEGLAPQLDREWPLLGDLNIAVTEWMFEKLGLNCRRVRASELNVTGAKEDLVIELCLAVGGTEYLSGSGARAYQHPENFERRGLALRYHQYQNQPYTQCHASQPFAPDLSALDLLLNAGPQARDIMLRGRRS